MNSGNTGAERRLTDLAIGLPRPPTPLGAYVEAVQAGNLLFLSGTLPVEEGVPKFLGRIGAELSVEDGRAATRLAALNALAVAKQHLGSLERVTRVVRLGISLVTTPEFREHPRVADAASELFASVFGADKTSTRLVFGMASRWACVSCWRASSKFAADIIAHMALTRVQIEELKRLASDAMRAHELVPEFPAAALAEANSASAASGGEARVLDLRALLWSSIDNDDSLDLDQIECAETLAGGRSKLRVGVADVDSVVKITSAIDEHARTNTTSVYTAAAIFSMLPERLSTNLTSLSQGVDRLCVVIEMILEADGELGATSVYRALVRNRAKLAYRGIAAWLQGTAAPPPAVSAVEGLDAQLRLQDGIAQGLKRRRQAKGALELDTAENRPVYAGGVLIDLQPDPKNRAQELIEEFMIAANGVTARFLRQHGRISVRRILRTPKRWDRIVELAKDIGESLPETPDPIALNAFLTRRRESDPSHFADLSLAVIKCLGPGEYVTERPGQAPEGHFGLAVQDYTHSTAPNRRYPDLLTQRLLKAVLDDHPAPYGDAELATLAAHCTVQEGNAKKVERQIDKSAAAMLLGSRIGARFEGVVTGASDTGTWVRIANPAAEGRIVKDFQGYDVGDHVRVQLLHVDVARGFIDFAGLK